MDIAKKQDKISELQQKIFRLEQENIDIISKYNNEIMTLRENKNSLESFKTNYYDLKNQFDLINMRLQHSSEENQSLKKDMINLEKENKNKNDIIDRIKGETRSSIVKERESDETVFNRNKETNAFNKKNELLNNSVINRPRYSNENVSESNNVSNNNAYKINSNNNNNMNSSYLNNSNQSNNNSNILNNSVNENKQNKIIDIPKKNKVSNNVSTILPSQAGFIKNESKILELENNLLSLQKKRDQVKFI